MYAASAVAVHFPHHNKVVRTMNGKTIFILVFLSPLSIMADTTACDEVIEHIDPEENHFYVGNFTSKIRTKRQIEPIFVGHPKTREEIWHQKFRIESITRSIEGADMLVQLLHKIVDIYLRNCIPIVVYDKFFEETDGIILQTFFQNLSFTYVHAAIGDNYKLKNPNILRPLDSRCRSYILFLSDILRAREILGPQTTSRVVIVSRSTQWRQLEFLSSKYSSDLINLIVIGESVSVDTNKDHPFVLYTHRLYTDGLGSNLPVMLTSWINKKLSRPHLNLFPQKFLKGFAGHRFTISAYHKPPYVIKKLSTDAGGNTLISWDGYEFRMLRLLSQKLNFSYDIVEPSTKNKSGPTYGVIDDVVRRRADLGLAGAYVASERLNLVEMSSQHSADCASFITLASKALPRYRAIMGPFQWPVWIAITLIYLVAIFPLAFSDKLTLSHLIGNWSEIENMFWYVFGTFTNSLTFTGKYSWSSSRKSSTRLLIGWYWVFTIIITACYTSSIIAFVTLPIFPETVDTISGLLWGFYRVGTLENDGWQFWFLNSSHAQTSRLMKNLEFVADVEEGLNNVTKAFFWPYAFIGSKSQLEFIVRDNYTDEKLGKRSALHIAEECLSIYGVSYLFPKDVVYTERFNDAILRIQAYGISNKILSDMEWDLQRKSKQTLLQSQRAKTFKVTDSEERGLTLADTEGMFLLMGIGYLIAGSVLISEVIGGCANKCRKIARRASTVSIGAISSSSVPNTMNTTRSENQDFSQSEWVISPKNTCNIAKRRRRSEQIGRPAEVKNGRHRRHNSLIPFMSDDLLSLPISSLSDEDDVHETKLQSVFKTIHFENGAQSHKVEINSPSTPQYMVDDTFGEKVIN